MIAVGAVLLVFGCKVYGQPRVGHEVFSWHKTLSGLEETPERFYAQVFQALKDGLQQYDISLSGFGFGPTHLFETRSIFAERPLYLQVRYKHLTYYLYCGHTPNGLFLSTWMFNQFLRKDGIAPTTAAYRYFTRQTIFQHDATLMFCESVHDIVLGVLERYIVEQNLKPLEELEKRPVMHAFYNPGFYQAAQTAALQGGGGLLGRRFLPL